MIENHLLNQIKRILRAVGLLLALPVSVAACLWDRDTPADEAKGQPEVILLAWIGIPALAFASLVGLWTVRSRRARRRKARHEEI